MPCMKTRGLEEEPAEDVVTSLAQVVLSPCSIIKC